MEKILMQSGKDDWETPQWLFKQLDNEFHFTLDTCSTHENAKCKNHYTEQDNGLLQDWGGRAHSATLRTVKKGIKMRGFANATKSRKSQIQPLLRYFLRGLTQKGFTNIYMEKLKSVSYAADCALNRTASPAGRLLSQAWCASGRAETRKYGGGHEF